MKIYRRAWVMTSLVMIFALALAACGGTAATDGDTGADSSASGETDATDGDTGADSSASGGIDCMGASEGDEVSILAQWSGEEEELFMTAIAPVVDSCGLSVVYEASRDQALLDTRVEAGDPWDIVIWPNRAPALVYSDMLQSLETVGADASNYNPDLVSAGSSGDAWLTIPLKVDPKSVVWYSPAAFEANGYSVPETWDEFVSLADQMASDGNVPFSMGFESSEATGWTASDFIQDILLATEGPGYVASIINGSVAYDDAGVASAYQIYVDWATDPAYAVGGAEGSLSTSFSDAILKPFADPPEAMMVKQSGFAGGAIAEQYPELEEGTDYAFFPFPGAQGVQVGADFMAVFGDSPATQAVVAYLTSAEGGARWASTGFGFTPNLGAAVSDYDASQAELAEFLASGASSPDIGDSIQPTFGSAEWTAIVDVVSGASSIDAALATAAEAQAADLGQ